ncbi:MAG TPA: hypothetical protein DC054_09590 [Blastocatellia bacterium]|nr:hypothetical protein [Blastocatellia bacterium]
MTANRAGNQARAVGLPNLVRAQGEDVQKLRGKDELARGRRIQSLPFCFGVRRLDAALFWVVRNARSKAPSSRRTPNYFLASGLIFIVSR